MEKLILEAAEKLFLEKGFDSTSTTQIAKEAGCNQALVHYYFRTKDNLFNVIFENKFKKFFSHIFEIDNLNELSFEEKIKHIIESHFQILNENQKMPLLIISELSRRPEQIKILKEKLQMLPEKFINQLDDELQIEIREQRVREMSLTDLLLSIISLNVSLFLLLPIASEILEMDENQKQFILNHRKNEHINIILKSLKP